MWWSTIAFLFCAINGKSDGSIVASLTVLHHFLDSRIVMVCSIGQFVAKSMGHSEKHAVVYHRWRFIDPLTVLPFESLNK